MSGGEGDRSAVTRVFKWGLLGTALLLCGVVVYACLAIAPQQHFSTRQSLGAVQVLGGPDELWCFVEVDRIVHNSDPIASPTSFSLGHTQEVLVLSESGDVRRIPVSIPEGVTFHSNISCILPVDGEIYLYQGFSMNTYRSVYRWETDHFRLLPLAESEPFLRIHALDAIDPADDAIDQIPLSPDWKRVYHDRGSILEPVFQWNGHTYELEYTNLDDSDTGSLSLHRVDGRSWTVELISWETTIKPITRDEMDAISDRRQRGHAR